MTITSESHPVRIVKEEALTIADLIKQLQTLDPATRFDPHQRLLLINWNGIKLASFTEIKDVS